MASKVRAPKARQILREARFIRNDNAGVSGSEAYRDAANVISQHGRRSRDADHTGRGAK